VLRMLAVATLVAASVVPASAQTLWEAPPLVSHVVPSGVSLFVLSPAGGDFGALVTFRHDAGPVGLGYRLALSDENPSGDLAVAGGVDISGFLSRAVEGSEIDVMWWSGAGVGIGNEAVLSVPVGALIGWSGQGDGAILSPYGGGHVTLDLSTDGQNNIDLRAAFDI